jgi:hypothetical protein
MRHLTLFPRMGKANFQHLESIANNTIPQNFVDFMTQNAGLSHFERYFKSNESIWEVHKYKSYIEMFELIKEFLQVGWGKMLPFAFDPGGWHFCLCLEQGEKYGGIYVNRWTDHLPDEQFLKIADTFQEFIDGLMTEDEAIAKGLL